MAKPLTLEQAVTELSLVLKPGILIALGVQESKAQTTRIRLIIGQGNYGHAEVQNPYLKSLSLEEEIYLKNMEYIPKKVIIQNVYSGKLKEITQVAWDVMVKYRMDKKWVLVNPDAPLPIVRKPRTKKVDIPPVTIVEEQPKEETPTQDNE